MNAPHSHPSAPLLPAQTAPVPGVSSRVGGGTAGFTHAQIAASGANLGMDPSARQGLSLSEMLTARGD